MKWQLAILATMPVVCFCAIGAVFHDDVTVRMEFAMGTVISAMALGTIVAKACEVSDRACRKP